MPVFVADIQFHREEDAEKALQALAGRFYAGSWRLLTPMGDTKHVQVMAQGQPVQVAGGRWQVAGCRFRHRDSRCRWQVAGGRRQGPRWYQAERHSLP